MDSPQERVPMCEHDGHPSHRLWQKGSRLHCSSSGTQAHLDRESKVIITTSLKKECKGAATRGSSRIQEMVRKRPLTGTPG